MEQRASNLCADAGSDFCPCYLSEIGRCINCGMLSSLNECECEWTGACIYCEYNWNGRASKTPRASVPAFVAARTMVSPDTVVLSLKLPTWLSRELRSPGAFLFLRPQDAPDYFDSPLSVMHVDSDLSVHIAVQVVGPKTWALCKEDRKLLARGPFESGMLGLQNLKRPARRALVITKGISQGRGVHTANYLSARGTEVTLAMGPGGVGSLFALKWYTGCSKHVIGLARKADKNAQDISNLLQSTACDLVVSAGPDVQHRMVHRLVKEHRPTARMSFTNNALMCCGEGVCGACGSHTADMAARACKSMPDTEHLLFLKGQAGGSTE